MSQALYIAIMKLPASTEAMRHFQDLERRAYEHGHRDARQAAAALVFEADGKPPQARPTITDWSAA